MLSRIVPVNSHVSCRTIPKVRLTSSRVRSRDVDAVEQDAPGVDLVEAHEQVHDRRLARARRPDDRDGLARCDREVEVGDQGPGGLVLEAHVIESRPARPDRGRSRLGAVRLFLFGVQQGKDPFGRGDAGLQEVHLACHLRDRHRELAGVLDESLDVAERERARRDPVSPDDRYPT